MDKISIDKEKINNIWFVSDIHYWHKNIVYGESIWDEKENNCRKFDTIQKMSSHIVNQINKYVKKDDVLFDLGDWSFGGIKNIWNLRKQLNVKTIHHINGNHDHHIINNKLLPNCYKTLNNKIIDVPNLDNVCILLDVYSQDIFNSVNDYLEIIINGRKICMMHYPIDEWNDMRKNSIMLHGHIHGEKKYIKNRLDVGIDNAYRIFGEYKPFNYNEILEILNNR